MDITENLQEIVSGLLATGMTQQQLADLVPCSQPTINAFLKGERGIRPSLKIGGRLVALYNERVSSKRDRAKKLSPKVKP